MQAVLIGLWETKLIDKSETRQGFFVLSGHYATQIWRPLGDLNPRRRRERQALNYVSQ